VISVRKVGDFVLQNLGRIEKSRESLRRNPAGTSAVHELRVSTRRLREGLLFLSEAKQAEKADLLLKEVRGLNRILGQARDMDVSVHLLKTEFSAAHRAAAAFAVKKLLRRRRRFARKVEKALKLYKGIRFAPVLKKMVSAAGAGNERVFEVLKERKRVLGRRLGAKPAKRQLHQIRVAVKKLRYDLEVWSGAGKTALEGRIEKLKYYQSLLGSWHDYEVLQHAVDRIQRKLGGGERRTWKKGLEALRRGISKREEGARREVADKMLRESRKLVRDIPV